MSFLKSLCGIELYIDTPNKELNTRIFNLLFDEKSAIENSSATKYSWENKDSTRYAAIRKNIDGSIYQTELWDILK